jgi:hypothetical protein
MCSAPWNALNFCKFEVTRGWPVVACVALCIVLMPRKLYCVGIFRKLLMFSVVEGLLYPLNGYNWADAEFAVFVEKQTMLFCVLVGAGSRSMLRAGFVSQR